MPIATATEPFIAGNPALLLTSRNFGTVEVFGADVNVEYQVDDRWRLGAWASFMSDDTFDAGGLPVALNAPKWKLGGNVGWTDRESGRSFRVSHRSIAEHPVRNAAFVGTVESYHLTDAGVSVDLPGFDGTTLQCDVHNLFGQSYRTYVGVPLMGRTLTLRGVYRR